MMGYVPTGDARPCSTKEERILTPLSRQPEISLVTHGGRVGEFFANREEKNKERSLVACVLNDVCARSLFCVRVLLPRLHVVCVRWLEALRRRSRRL